MRKDKQDAYQLRRAGKSYNEISQELRVPKSTLSTWFKEIGWSKELGDILSLKVQKQHTSRLVELGKIRSQRLKLVYEQAALEARDELEILKYNPLFIAGLMLYWGEGDKVTKHRVRIANTDPALVYLFIRFLKNACNIEEERIKIHIVRYPDIDDMENKVFWSNQLRMPLESFWSTTTIVGKHKTRRLGHGICTVCVSSSYFKVKIKEWINLLPTELMKVSYYENIQ